MKNMKLLFIILLVIKMLSKNLELYSNLLKKLIIGPFRISTVALLIFLFGKENVTDQF